MPAAKLYSFSESKNPTDEMLKVMKKHVVGIEVAGARVLVWPYIRSKVMPSGLIAGTDNTTREDLYQGAVGYVLKTGPLAFKDDEHNKFAGFAAKAGDWVTFVPGEGKRIQIDGVDCRLFEDALIHTKIPDPTIITHQQ